MKTEFSEARQQWLIIFGALVASVAIYGLMCFFIAQNPKSHPASLVLTQARPVVIGLGIASLLASVLWLRFAVDGKIGGDGRPMTLSASEFQTRSIIALALAEACALFGLLLFFLGAPLADFGLFALGTLLIDFAFVLPRGLAFWMRQA